MSKKFWRLFDRVFIFGAFFLGGSFLVNTLRSCMIDNGSILPEEQKDHLKYGAGYVKSKFDNVQLTPASRSTVAKINAAKNYPTEQVSEFKPAGGKSFSELAGDTLIYSGESSPLGNTLETEYTPPKPSQSQIKKVSVPNNKKVIIPRTAKESSGATLCTGPKDAFVVDLKTVSNEVHRFSFSLIPTKQKGMLKFKVMEYAGSTSEIGGNAKINMIYFDPSKAQEGGKAFSIIFNHKKNFLIAPYDTNLDQAIFIARGDKISISYDRATKSISVLGKNLKEPSDMKKVAEATRYISVKHVPVPQRIIQSHKNRRVPIVNPRQEYQR